jgi:hydroxymethylbilane synthase
MNPGKDRVIVASRGSKLALAQTRQATNLLSLSYPDIKFEIKVFQTSGDSSAEHNSAIVSEFPGVFVKEIEAALLRGEADLAVHSLKDMPLESDPSLEIAAVLPREDPRDALYTRDGARLKDMPAQSLIGTSSPRRLEQIKALRNDIQVKPIRGNVDTRIRKVEEGIYDGIVVALAGLKRLGLYDWHVCPFSVEEIVPAPGQGIIAIQGCSGSYPTKLAAKLNNRATWTCARAERAFLKAMGGGCASIIGAYAELSGSTIMLSVVAKVGSELVRLRCDGTARLPEVVAGRAAEKMLALSA